MGFCRAHFVILISQYKVSSYCFPGKYRAEKAENSAQIELTSLEGAVSPLSHPGSAAHPTQVGGPRG